MAKTLRMVVVTWRDAIHEHHGWTSDRSLPHQEDTVQSMGWLVRKDARSLTLAQTDGIDSFANTIQLPMPMVIKITFLVPE